MVFFRVTVSQCVTVCQMYRNVSESVKWVRVCQSVTQVIVICRCVKGGIFGQFQKKVWGGVITLAIGAFKNRLLNG